MKKVSIMIPTYNQSNYIQHTIESALAQDYPNLEIIISDDSTDDLTENLVHELYQNELLAQKISYYHNRPPLGRVNNYHKTLYEYSSGDYVLNLDGDDWLMDPHYISECVILLDQNPSVMCTMAKKKHFIEASNEFIDSKGFHHLEGIVNGNDYIWETILGNAEFNHLTALYRRNEALKIDFYTLNDTASDADSVFRLMCEHKIALIDKFIGAWRVHKENATFVEWKRTNFKDLFKFEENIFYLCQKRFNKSSPYKQWLNMWKTQTIIHYLVYLVKNRDSSTFSFLRYILLHETSMLFYIPMYLYHKKIIKLISKND